MSITSEQIVWLKQCAALDGATIPQALLHLLERVELLERRLLREESLKAGPTPEPTPPAAPAGGLVERVLKVIADPDGPAELWHDDARAAIREVAAWLDQRGKHGCSLWLREEADQ